MADIDCRNHAVLSNYNPVTLLCRNYCPNCDYETASPFSPLGWYLCTDGADRLGDKHPQSAGPVFHAGVRYPLIGKLDRSEGLMVMEGGGTVTVSKDFFAAHFSKKRYESRGD